jgi:hypothetical protein
MSRWSLLALVTLITALAGGYILFSRPGILEREGAQRAEAELSVEEFDPENGVDDEAGADVEGEGEAAAPKAAQVARPSGGAKAAARPKPAAAAAAEGHVETIEDEEMLGETIDEPLVIEDEDERGTVEVAQPAP